MKTGQKVTLRIKIQGAPRIRKACVWRGGNAIVAVLIDLRSNFCESGICLSSSDKNFAQTMFIRATEGSTELHEKYKREDSTMITFPQFNGWNIYPSTVGMSTIMVFFEKRRNIRESERLRKC